MPRHGADEVEEPVQQVAAEHVAGHVLRRWHPLQRRVREERPRQQRVGQLEPERLGQLGVDLECVTQAELPVLEAGLLGEVLVEELAHRHGVRRVDGVGGGEVVVLAGVDDDPGARVDLAREPLVDEGPDRVDVAEEDPVHRVVQHHVEPLEPRQCGDLRHAQARGVVGQPDVAADLLARLVEGRPHQPEVLLGGVGARIPLVGGALRHVVEQRLPGGPDDGDDVGALPRGRLGLRDVLVDVAGGDDEVDPGPLRWVAEPADEALTGGALPVDGPQATRDGGTRGAARAGQLGALREAERDRARGGLLREGQQVFGLRPAQRVPDGSRDPVLQPDLAADRVDEVVDPRDALVVRSARARRGAASRARLRRSYAAGPAGRPAVQRCAPASGPGGRPRGRARGGGASSSARDQDIHDRRLSCARPHGAQILPLKTA